MLNPISPVDPDGLLEYSVVFTDRSLNHMSAAFQEVMRDLSTGLKSVYGAEHVAIVPGGGSFAMETVARQFANDARCLIIRNGWFSFRWSQILAAGRITDDVTVLQARRTEEAHQAPFAPCPIDEIVADIHAKRPQVVFAPHVETSAGIMLPDESIKAVADAAHAVGALFVLDCVASGTVWVDMAALGVDVLISAPQKGWSSSPCAGLIMLSARAREQIEATTASSFACDLKKWLQIMQTYENGGHAYHATMPTDALRSFRDTLHETEHYGFARVKADQQTLGTRVRGMLEAAGFRSVAAVGFQAPSVVVSYSDDADIHNGKKFASAGLQIAAGVPLECGEPADFRTFRIGLFGLDKLQNQDRTVAQLEAALARVTG